MNSLTEEIKRKINEVNSMKGSEVSLKFEIEFEEEEDILQENEYCKMDIELFNYEDGKYFLEFRRTGGKFDAYYNNFMKIKEIIEEKYILND